MRAFSWSLLTGFLSAVALTGCESGTGPVLVTQVQVTASSSSLTVGDTLRLAASPRDASGKELSGRAIAWSSSSEAVATVSGEGMVSAKAAGAVTITATVEDRAGSVALTITPVPVASLTIEPASFSLQAGATQALKVTARDAEGNALAGRAVTLVSSNAGVASLNGATVTAAAAGTATITASSEGKTATAQVTVTPVPVASVRVSPDTATVQVGSTRQVTATLGDVAGNTLTDRTVAWSSSDTTRAKVSGSGLVTVFREGEVIISATAEGKSGSARIMGSAVDTVRVLSAAMLLEGRTKQLGAQVRDSRKMLLTTYPVAWTSSNPSVLSVSASGVAVAQREGSATVTASAGGKQGTMVVQVVRGGYTVTGLGTAGGTSSRAQDLNDLGQVVVDWQTSGGERKAFLWQRGTFTDLAPTATFSSAYEINNKGQVVGVYRSGSHLTNCGRAFLWQNGAATDILGQECGSAMAINESAQIAGRRPAGAFLWQNGNVTAVSSAGTYDDLADIKAIGDQGLIVGSRSTRTSALSWYQGVISFLPGTFRYTWAYDVNDAGQIAGAMEVSFYEGTEAVVWHGANRTRLGALGGHAEGRGINNRGEVVGESGGRGFVWQSGGMSDLNDLLVDPSWVITTAVEINESGQILGEGRNLKTGVTDVVLLTPVR